MEQRFTRSRLFWRRVIFSTLGISVRLKVHSSCVNVLTIMSIFMNFWIFFLTFLTEKEAKRFNRPEIGLQSLLYLFEDELFVNLKPHLLLSKTVNASSIVLLFLDNPWYLSRQGYTNWIFLVNPFLLSFILLRIKLGKRSKKKTGYFMTSSKIHLTPTHPS